MIYPDFEELVALGAKAKSLSVKTNNRVENSLVGTFAASLKGQGMEFEEVREYVHGDDIRNIDWRVTARTGKPHLKLFKQDMVRDVIICLDNSSDLYFATRGTFKLVQAARVASLIAWSAHYNKDRVGAVVFGDMLEKTNFFSPSFSRKSILRFLKSLTVQQQGGGDYCLDSALQDIERTISKGAAVFIIASWCNISPNFEKNLTRLSKKARPVIVSLTDIMDYQLPDAGIVEFNNDSGNIVRLDTSSRDLAKAYHDIWQENNNKLISVTKKLNLRHIDIKTNADACENLLEGLR